MANKLDFVYINDLVDAVWLVINSKETNGKVYNLGTGKQTSLNEIFNILKITLVIQYHTNMRKKNWRY